MSAAVAANSAARAIVTKLNDSINRGRVYRPRQEITRRSVLEAWYSLIVTLALTPALSHPMGEGGPVTILEVDQTP